MHSDLSVVATVVPTQGQVSHGDCASDERKITTCDFITVIEKEQIDL